MEQDGILSCDVGYGYNSTKDTCEKCSENTFKAEVGTASCLPCPANATCETKEFTCAAGYQIVNQTCVQCLNGFFKPKADKTECQPCPANHICTAAEAKCMEGKVCKQDANSVNEPFYTGYVIIGGNVAVVLVMNVVLYVNYARGWGVTG